MPFKSKAQMRAAFGGYLGSEMKAKAGQWAAETPSPSKLPDRVPDRQKALEHEVHRQMNRTHK